MQQLAREIGVEGGVRTVACGAEGDSHLAEVCQALTDCTESGGWLVLLNTHLARGLWTGKLLHLLQVGHIDSLLKMSVWVWFFVSVFLIVLSTGNAA